jgi:hypothetical protein
MKIAVFAMLSSTLCASIAHAGDHVMIFGQGSRPCQEWTVNRQAPTNPKTTAMEAWVGGFVTAFNAYSPHRTGDVLHGITAEAVWTWLDNYCRINPADQLAVAATGLIKDMATVEKQP